MAFGGRAERRRRALKRVEHYQSSLTREFLRPRDDRLDMRRMQYHCEWLGGRLGKLGDAIQHLGQLIFMRRPACGAKSGPDFQDDRIDDRVAIQDAQDSIEIALINTAADRAARVERIAIASADD